MSYEIRKQINSSTWTKPGNSVRDQIDGDAEKSEAIAAGLNEQDADVAAALVRGSRVMFANTKRWPDISSYPAHILNHVMKVRGAKR